MFRKKGQAAMEFLMTYGWAILVVLVAIGALAYFGVLSPDRFLPERCSGPSGLDCVDKASISAETAAGNDGELVFVVQNNQGFQIGVNDTGSGGGMNPTITPETGSECTTGVVEVSCSGATTDDGGGAGSGDDDGIWCNNNDAMTVTISCSAGGPATGRFKGLVTVPYINRETGLHHVAQYSITGRAV